MNAFKFCARREEKEGERRGQRCVFNKLLHSQNILHLDGCMVHKKKTPSPLQKHTAVFGVV